MCLRVKSELKTADKDLYVIKKLINFYDKLKSPYRGTTWTLKELKTAKLSEKRCIGSEVNVGFHSLIKPGWFYHLYNDDVLMVCKIPKGSKYYLGINGDVVSDKLEIVEKAWEFSKFSPVKRSIRFLHGARKAFKFLEQKYGKQQY